MNTLLITSILLFSIISVRATPIPWKLCPDTDNSMLEVTDVTVDPWPTVKGRPSFVEVKGVAKVDIRQTNGRLDVYMGDTRIFSSAIGGAYSVSRGQAYDYTFNYAIPSFVPPGSYEGRISYSSVDRGVFTCISLPEQF